MRALVSPHRIPAHHRASGQTRPHLPAAMPTLQNRAGLRRPESWCRQQRAHYYFDAGQQTAKTLRVLLSEIAAGGNRLGLQTSSQLLAQSMEGLLQSICPQIEDDASSRHYFLSLLQMHLSGLSAGELQQLTQGLRSAQFSDYVVESVMEEGLASRAPDCRTRTLLHAGELFTLLENFRQNALRNQVAVTKLDADIAKAVRVALAASARDWRQSSHSLADVSQAARDLAAALSLPPLPDKLVSASLTSHASMLALYKTQLCIEPAVAACLAHDHEGKLFANLLRDMLELLLTKKLFDQEALTPSQSRTLQAAIDQIIDHTPPDSDTRLKAQAHLLWAGAARFGRMQILPTKGVALGHAWIAPSLSLTPDTSLMGKAIGQRFMHSGFQLNPGLSTIREWPLKFLSAAENEELYPAHFAWHLPVPVDLLRLQQAAADITQDWQERGLPYRFIGTRPGMDATGCRITVWQAIQRGLDTNARALFDHYNCGLPEPESPTELWLRMDGLMRWLEELGK